MLRYDDTVFLRVWQDEVKKHDGPNPSEGSSFKPPTCPASCIFEPFDRVVEGFFTYGLLDAAEDNDGERVEQIGGQVSEQTGIPGELIYEYTLQFTEVVEYGVSMEALLSGQLPPPEGARFDVYFAGPATGPKLKGTVRGVDYLHIRADGRAPLHIHAEITTEDAKKISLAADGVALLEQGSTVLQLKENVTLTTSHPEYSWVNPIQVWAPGTVDLGKGEIRIKAYAV